jgi:hypothetical protein
VTPVVTNIRIFWDIIPCNPLKVNGHFEETCHLHPQGQRIIQVRNQRKAGSKQRSSILKMKATCCSETLDFQRTTRRYITEEGTVIHLFTPFIHLFIRSLV